LLSGETEVSHVHTAAGRQPAAVFYIILSALKKQEIYIDQEDSVRYNKKKHCHVVLKGNITPQPLRGAAVTFFVIVFDKN
jgi:hypothetical protein